MVGGCQGGQVTVPHRYAITSPSWMILAVQIVEGRGSCMHEAAGIADETTKTGQLVKVRSGLRIYLACSHQLLLSPFT